MGRSGESKLITADCIDGRAVQDVRQVAEYASGHLPDVVHGELGDLPGRARVRSETSLSGGQRLEPDRTHAILTGWA